MTRASVHSRAESVLLHAGFILTGIVTTILGPILPFLASRWILSDAKAGSLFTAQFLGSVLGGLSISVLIPRRGFRFALVAGFLLMAAGVGFLGLSPWPLGWFATFGYGIGLGLVIPAANLYVSDVSSQRRAAALNLLNLSWGIGAVACPILVLLLHGQVGLSGFLVSLAVVLAGCASALSALKFASVSPLSTGQPSATLPRRAGLVAAARALGALFFLYVGTENAFSGWVSTYAKRISAPEQALWVATPSVFWGALLMGRALAPVALRYLTEVKLAATGLVIALGGALGIVFSTTVLEVRLGAGVAGFGLAPVYPIFIAWLGQRFGADAPRPGGVMFALAGCGGATLPWLVGQVSTSFASLKVGLVVPLIGCLLMLAILSAPCARAGTWR